MSRIGWIYQATSGMLNYVKKRKTALSSNQSDFLFKNHAQYNFRVSN